MYFHRSLAGGARRRRIRSKKQVVFAVAFIICAGVIFFSQTKSLRLNEVAISGVGAEKESIVSEALNEILEGHLFLLFPKSHVLWYPKGELEDALASFPWVASVDIKRQGVRSIEVRIEERKSALLWCQSFQGTCFSLDEDGVIFAVAEKTPEAVIFYAEDAKSYDLGDAVIDRIALERILSFTEFFKERFVVSRVRITEDGDFALEIEGGPYILIGREEDDMVLATENLLSLLGSEAFSSGKESDDTLSSLEYIDLRFGRKIFYRRK